MTPAHIYVLTQGVVGVLFATGYTTYGVYAVRTAGLGPLELVLVGTALELSVTLAEVPTGVVADVYSRRLSVIIGLAVIGLGFMVMGSVPTFGGLAGGSILMGIGYTFISGAHQAWLADEIDEAPVAAIYLRGTQFGQLGRVAPATGCSRGFSSRSCPSAGTRRWQSVTAVRGARCAPRCATASPPCGSGRRS